MFTYNKDKGLEVLKNAIRYKRLKLFPQLDTQFIRALETGNTEMQAEVVSKKEILRNLTDISIDGIESRDELIALWPEDILGRNPFPKNS
jgi:hypothetical protein